MPTYEYACTSCGQHLEVFQSFSEEPLTTCPHCGGDLRKVFGAVGIVLKGSGFYRTDSRATSSSKTATKEKKDSESSGAGSDAAASTSSGSSSAATPSPATDSPSKTAAAAG